jgi:hypothetical protein
VRYSMIDEKIPSLIVISDCSHADLSTHSHRGSVREAPAKAMELLDGKIVS